MATTTIQTLQQDVKKGRTNDQIKLSHIIHFEKPTSIPLLQASPSTYDDMLGSELVRMMFGAPGNEELHATGYVTSYSGQLVRLQFDITSRVQYFVEGAELRSQFGQHEEEVRGVNPTKHPVNVGM